ncbi:MAG TPA: hypothetical protein DIU15_01720 [Deltaproteobacteria bacterium]|nr:hypothetical protein [Deltaproteobacteria bacterium]
MSSSSLGVSSSSSSSSSSSPSSSSSSPATQLVKSPGSEPPNEPLPLSYTMDTPSGSIISYAFSYPYIPVSS